MSYWKTIFARIILLALVALTSGLVYGLCVAHDKTTVIGLTINVVVSTIGMVAFLLMPIDDD